LPVCENFNILLLYHLIKINYFFIRQLASNKSKIKSSNWTCTILHI